MVYHEKVVHNILYHALENTVANTINAISAAHDGKVECNNVEYTTAFLSVRLALFRSQCVLCLKTINK